MAAVVASLAQNIFQRQRDRLRSDRVDSHDNEEEENESIENPDDDDAVIDAEEEGSFLNDRQPSENNNNNNNNNARTQDESESSNTSSDGVHSFVARPTMTLAELEEEREVARRRSSACFLFAIFVLFRMWIYALGTSDFTLILICLFGTSWAFRWIQYNRDQEAELDRRIAQYLEHHNNDHEIARDDIRMLSFQAQLALAIMESQRQMMMGGYGNPDGPNPDAGVSDEHKSRWQNFAYKEMRDKLESRLSSSSYGSLQQQQQHDESENSEDKPHCSICLGEYEEGEALIKLPCGHIFHDECINSWCSSHTRCPLCNLDLAADPVTPKATTAEDQV